MKKIILIFIFLCPYLTIRANDTISAENPLTRNLKLKFDANAIHNNTLIEWVIQSDFDNLDINFSQGEHLHDNTLRVWASTYKEYYNKTEGIRLTIKPKSKAKEGIYSFKMEVVNYSNGLEGVDTAKLNLHINNIVILPIPFNWTKFVIFILVILLVAFIIIYFILQSQKFKSGSILIEEPKEKADTYFLKGTRKYYLSQFYKCEVYLKKGSDGLPKIFYKNETIYINGEFAKKGYQLATMDECEIITVDNQKIKFVYQ